MKKGKSMNRKDLIAMLEFAIEQFKHINQIQVHILSSSRKLQPDSVSH